MLSKADICNGALSHLGVSTEIQDLVSEKSKEAQACRRFYDRVRDEVLRDFAWPFAKQDVALAVVTDHTDDENSTSEWSYEYRYPEECIAVRRLYAGGATGRLNRPELRIEYRIGQDDAGSLILTDLEDAICEYTKRIDDPTRYPADFAAAFEFLLAAKIGPRVAGGDQFKLSDRALKLYAAAIAKARSNAANEEQPDEPEAGEMERARG